MVPSCMRRFDSNSNTSSIQHERFLRNTQGGYFNRNLRIYNFKGIVRLKCYKRFNYFPKSRKSGNANEVSKNKPFFGAHREIQLIMMTLSFIVSWAPFGMVYLVKLWGFREKGSHHKSDVLTLLCVKLGCGIITPIVCVFENSQVTFKDLISLKIIKIGILIYL